MSKPTIKQLVETCKKISYSDDDSKDAYDVEKALEFLFVFGFLDLSKIQPHQTPVVSDPELSKILRGKK